MVAICVLTLIVVLVATLILSANLKLIINPTQVHYLSSTSAQTVAAFYGSTVAGYSFYASNNLPNESDDAKTDSNLFSEVARGVRAN